MEDLEDWTMLSQKLGIKSKLAPSAATTPGRAAVTFATYTTAATHLGGAAAVQDLISLFEPKKTHCKPNKATSSVNHSALTAVATAKPAANELLLTVVSRLSGPHSLLHAGSRTFEDKEAVMKEKMESNTSMIDCKIKLGQYVVASKDQQKAIAEFTHSPDKRHATFRGPPGSGKTLMMGSTIRIIIGKAKKKVFLILLSCGNNTPADQLHNFLDSETSSLPIDNCLIFPHNTSMKHFNLPSIPLERANMGMITSTHRGS